MAAVMVVALLVRLRFVLAADFPLHEGGLFYAMVRELQRAHYALPAFTSYNNLHIPFAYPPLALYLTAFSSDLFHADPLTVLRFLPLVANVATIGAFHLLARSWLHDRVTACCATIAFAFVPSGFVLLIEGGGITRSFGLLFAVLTLWQLHGLYTHRRVRNGVWAAICCGLMVLSHIEFAMFIATSVALVLLARRRDRCAVRASLGVAAGAALVISPWFVAVALRHGLTPFVHTLHSGDPLPLRLYLLLGASSESTLPVIASCALLGLFSRRARRLWLPLWLVALYLVDSRGAKMYGSVPLAMLAACGVVDVLLPIVRRAAPPRAVMVEEVLEGRATGVRRSRPAPALAAFAALATISALVVPASYLGALSSGQRAAMAWVTANVADGARFVVLGGDGAERDAGWAWELDRSAEWFPALTGRTSITTYEGHEWLGDYGRVQDDFWKLILCTERDGGCLEAWAARSGHEFSYVYVPKGAGAEAGSYDSRWCCWSLRNSMRADPRYITIYDGPGATIFARRG